MATLLQGTTSQLQGTTPFLQGGYNPQNTGAFIGPTMNMAATTPTTPKSTYLAKQVASQTPASTDNNPAALAAANQSFFNSNPNVFGGSQTQNPAPTAPSPQAAPVPTQTNFNGTSTGVAGQGVYDPYNSPAYQQYLSNYMMSLQPSQPELDAQAQLANISSSEALGVSSKLGQALPMDILTGQQNLIRSQAQAQAQVSQNSLDYYQKQRELKSQAYGAGLNSANTNAGYLAGLAKPTPLSPGQSLVLPNPGNGTAQTLGSVPSYNAVANPLSPSGITTYNQTTGQQNNGLGSTPPSLGGLAAQYMQNPLIASYVQATRNSNGDMNAAGVPAQYQPAVNTVLQSQSGGAYSPGNAAINQGNIAAQSHSLNDIQPIAKVTTANMQALQQLADKVNYSNSPITNDLRNQFSGTFLTNPDIETLSSALGFVTSEVSQVLGGGSSTVAALNEASNSLQANKLSPETLKSVIANAQLMINNRLKELGDTSNAASLPTGLQMPSGYSASIPAGALAF